MDEDLEKLKKVVKILTFAVVRIVKECSQAQMNMSPQAAAEAVGDFAKKELQ